jgi:hypothetical protein
MSLDAVQRRRIAADLVLISVGQRRIRGIDRPRHRCARYDNHVVELGTDATVCSGTMRSLDRRSRGSANLVGPNPEQEADPGATFDAQSLVGGGVSCLWGAQSPFTRRSCIRE